MSNIITPKLTPGARRVVTMFVNPTTGRYVKFGSKTFKNVFGNSCEGIERVSFTPNAYQSAIERYYRDLDYVQGIILYWSLGSGKTCGAIMIMDIIIGRLLQSYRMDKTMYKYFDIVGRDMVPRVNFVVPGSLSQNFWYEYCSRCGNYREYAPYFKYIIYNAYKAPDALRDPKGLANSIIIIDEAHNIVRGKINNSENVYVIEYDTILEAKHQGAIVIALTGTPILRTDSMYYLFNLVAREEDEYRNINEYIREMYMGENMWHYIPAALMRMGPYVSRVRSAGGIEEGVPEVSEHMVPLAMSAEQTFIYKDMADNEYLFYPSPSLKKTDPEKYKRKKQQFYLALSMKNSRGALNMVYPNVPEEYLSIINDLKNKYPEALIDKYDRELNLESFRNRYIWVDKVSENDDERYHNFIHSINEVETYINMRLPYPNFTKVPWIIPSFIDELGTYSAKMQYIVNFITQHNEFKHAVYSEFKTKSGIYMIGALLNLYGIKVAYFTGDLTEEKRVEVITEFNDVSNAYGANIKVLLLSKAGGEGQTFKDVRYLHILEQSIDELGIDQIKGRFVRLGSHSNLPKTERKVDIYRYFGTKVPKNIKIDTLTFDDLMGKYYTLVTTSDFKAYQYGMNKKHIIEGLVSDFDIFGPVYTSEIKNKLMKMNEEFTTSMSTRLEEENITIDNYYYELEEFFEVEDPYLASSVGIGVELETPSGTTVPFVTMNEQVERLAEDIEDINVA